MMGARDGRFLLHENRSIYSLTSRFAQETGWKTDMLTLKGLPMRFKTDRRPPTRKEAGNQFLEATKIGEAALPLQDCFAYAHKGTFQPGGFLPTLHPSCRGCVVMS